MREGEVKGRTRNHRKGGGSCNGVVRRIRLCNIINNPVKVFKSKQLCFYFTDIKLVCRSETQETTIEKQFEYKPTK